MSLILTALGDRVFSSKTPTIGRCVYGDLLRAVVHVFLAYFSVFNVKFKVLYATYYFGLALNLPVSNATNLISFAEIARENRQKK